MKKFMPFIAGIVLANAALGQVTGSTYVDVGNRYLGPGFGDVLCEDPVIQPGVDLEFGNGFNGGIWFSHSPNDQERDYGEEMDFIFGWSGPMPQQTALAEGAELDVSLTYYDEPTRLVFGKGDIWCLSARSSVPLGNWTHSFGVSRYEPMPGSDFPAAWLFGPAIERTLDLGSDFSVTAENQLNYGHGYGFGSGFILNPNLALEYAASEDVTWSLKAIGYVQLGTNDERDNELAVSVGVEKSF
jgi:hypothetical protein